MERAVEVRDSWADCIASHQDELEPERETKRPVRDLNETRLLVTIPGAPNGWVPPCHPEDWKPNPKKLNKKEPDVPFDVIDNLGSWSECAFRPNFAGKALFFFQLILPMHNVDNAKVLMAAADPSKTFCLNVARWTNVHACEELGILGGGYGHEFEATTPMESL